MDIGTHTTTSAFSRIVKGAVIILAVLVVLWLLFVVVLLIGVRSGSHAGGGIPGKPDQVIRHGLTMREPH